MSSVFNDPTHSRLLKIWNEMDVPGFVKEAAAITEQDFDVVDVTHFADPANRLYPLNTKSNTWLSREYFRRDQPNLNKQAADIIGGRITKMAAFWGLDDSIQLQEEPRHTIHCITLEDDIDKQIVTIDVTGHYKQAAEAFCRDRNNYTYGMRRSFARQMLGAPADAKEPLEVETEQMLCKMANYGSCTAESARNAVFMRMCMIRNKDPETFGQLVKVAKHVGDMEGLLDIDVLHKVARILDVVDRTHGFHVRYGRTLNAPEDDLFHFTEKKAGVVRDEAIVLADGTIINRFALLQEREKAHEYFEKVAGVTHADDESMVDAVIRLGAQDVPALLNFLEA